MTLLLILSCLAYISVGIGVYAVTDADPGVWRVIGGLIAGLAWPVMALIKFGVWLGTA